MRSMTGFGKRAAAAVGIGAVTVEIGSVNRKQLELRIALPPELAAFDPVLRRRIGDAVSRGSVQVRVTFQPDASAGTGIRINRPVLEALVRELAGIRRECGLDPERIAVEELLRLPGVLQEETFVPGEAPELENALLTAFDGALAEFLDMRAVEGEHLKRDFEQRLALLESLLAQIEPLTSGIPAAVKARLLEKIAAERLPVDPSDERLLKEVLFYADKADVTEEITRLRSHFAQFRRFLAQPEPAGRSLDFLMQEFFREITTLGNKAGVPAVSPLVVAFKSEVEKLREQIQNVE